MSPQAKLFITKALQKNPDQRFTIESLINDKFLDKPNPFLSWKDISNMEWLKYIYFKFINSKVQ